MSGGAGGSSYLSPDVFDGATAAGTNSGAGYVSIQYGNVDNPIFSTTSLPHATAGTPYSFQLAASGWPAPSFSGVAGSLPTGLALSDDGKLTGTLTTAGTYTFSVAAINPEALNSEQVQLVVDPGAPAGFTAGIGSPTGGSGSVPAGSFGAAVARVTDSYGNPEPNVTVTFQLPTQFRFVNGTSGSQSYPTGADGQATAVVQVGPNAGTWPVKISAPGTSLPQLTDSVTVVRTAPALTGAGLQPAGAVSIAYDDAVQVSGAPSPTLSVSAGQLPPGLALAADHITGTPTTAGTFSFTLKAANGAASTPAHASYKIVIARKPLVSVAPVGTNPGPVGSSLLVPFPVTLAAPLSVPVTVPWKTKAGTATSPRDFVATTGNLVIPAGATTGTIYVQVNGHNPDAQPRHFSVVLGNPDHARTETASNTATGTIY